MTNNSFVNPNISFTEFKRWPTWNMPQHLSNRRYTVPAKDIQRDIGFSREKLSPLQSTWKQTIISNVKILQKFCEEMTIIEVKTIKDKAFQHAITSPSTPRSRKNSNPQYVAGIHIQFVWDLWRNLQDNFSKLLYFLGDCKMHPPPKV